MRPVTRVTNLNQCRLTTAPSQIDMVTITTGEGVNQTAKTVGVIKKWVPGEIIVKKMMLAGNVDPIDMVTIVKVTTVEMVMTIEGKTVDVTTVEMVMTVEVAIVKVTIAGMIDVAVVKGIDGVIIGMTGETIAGMIITIAVMKTTVEEMVVTIGAIDEMTIVETAVCPPFPRFPPLKEKWQIGSRFIYNSRIGREWGRGPNRKSLSD